MFRKIILLESAANSFSTRILWSFLALFIFNSSVLLAQYENTGRSVVQIEAEGAPIGIGAVIIEKDLIVTALHVVAGIKKPIVYSLYRGDGAEAYIYRVHKESDLALLKLKTPLNLPPLKITKAVPKTLEKYLIWGYDATPEVLDRNMRLAGKLWKLTSIIEPATQNYTDLENNGYPSPNATIIRLDDPIFHGDSGSPITDVNGNIIGIADGGLHGGGKRKNWGISAATYFDKLWNSTEEVKMKESSAAFLKSARSQNKLFTDQDDLAIYKIFTDELGNISGSASRQEWEAVDHYYRLGLESSNKDILFAMVDIYEDYNTGATMAIPAGLEFDYDQDNGWLEAWTDNNNVEMNILIKQAESFEDALTYADEFKSYLLHEGNWQPSPTKKDLPGITNWEEQYFDQSMIRVQYNYNGEIISDFLAEISVNNNYVMATSVKVLDIKDANTNTVDWYYCYLMEACLALSGFSID